MAERAHDEDRRHEPAGRDLARRSGGAAVGSPPLMDARATTLALLGRRAAGATLCPSEVARALAAAGDTAGDTAGGTADWRGQMAAVHAAVDGLVADGTVRLSWKRATLPVRDGPYRIGRARTTADRPYPPVRRAKNIR